MSQPANKEEIDRTLVATKVPESQDIYALLAQANLLRIRGNWQEAVEKCMEAMRLVPGNVGAQSLLGDIYENQGAYDDAIQWYRMALDANPSSPADRQRLTRILAMRGETFDDPYDSRAPGPRTTVMKVQARDRDLALRVMAFGFGFVVLAVILTAVVQSRAQLRGRPRSAGTPASIDTPPIMLGQSQIDQGSMPTPRDPFEVSLFDSLRLASDGLDQSMRFSDVIADPRTGRLTLTYIIQPFGELDRETVLRSALRVTQTVERVQQTSAYSYFTLRILLNSNNVSATETGASLIFIGDTGRADLVNYPGDASSVPSPQLQLAFSNQWWAPGLANANANS